MSADESDEARPRWIADDGPEVVFEIRLAQGKKARDLQLEQARVLREVIEWIAQRRSGRGQDRAA